MSKLLGCLFSGLLSIVPFCVVVSILLVSLASCAYAADSVTSHDGTLTTVGLFLLAVYFFPWIVALCRGHLSVAGIFVVNLAFGWSLLGWVIALAWSLNGNTRRNQRAMAMLNARALGEYAIAARCDRLEDRR